MLWYLSLRAMQCLAVTLGVVILISVMALIFLAIELIDDQEDAAGAVFHERTRAADLSLEHRSPSRLVVPFR